MDKQRNMLSKLRKNCAQDRHEPLEEEEINFSSSRSSPDHEMPDVTKAVTPQNCEAESRIKRADEAKINIATRRHSRLLAEYTVHSAVNSV